MKKQILISQPMKGLTEAKGCKLEHNACIVYGVPVYYESN